MFSEKCFLSAIESPNWVAIWIPLSQIFNIPTIMKCTSPYAPVRCRTPTVRTGKVILRPKHIFYFFRSSKNSVWHKSCGVLNVKKLLQKVAPKMSSYYNRESYSNVRHTTNSCDRVWSHYYGIPYCNRNSSLELFFLPEFLKHSKRHNFYVGPNFLMI